MPLKSICMGTGMVKVPDDIPIIYKKSVFKSGRVYPTAQADYRRFRSTGFSCFVLRTPRKISCLRSLIFISIPISFIVKLPFLWKVLYLINVYVFRFVGLVRIRWYHYVTEHVIVSLSGFIRVTG